jgi:anti-sigma B factor antagonist
MSDLAQIEMSEHGDGIHLARICGDLDLSNLRDVHATIVDALPNDAVGLVVDLGDVKFLDSSGVETLFRLRRSLSLRQQRFAVAIPPDAVTRRALVFSGAEGDLALHDTVEDAVAAVRSSA